MTASIERKVQAGFAFSLACFGAIGIVSWLAVERLQTNAAWVEHTHEVIVHLEELFSNLTDAQNGHRGYVLTGDERFIDPYRHALETAPAAIHKLQQLTADNPLQLQRMKSLTALVSALLERSRHVIEVRRAEGVAGGLREALSGKGKQLHDDFRRVIDEMKATEESLLAQRQHQTHRSSTLAQTIIVSGSALTFAFVSFALLAIRRAFVDRQRAEAERLEAHAAAQAQAAVHESEARYRTLFETLIEGFCTIEMIFDENGKPVDYRFLEINPAFEKQTGLRNAQGKLMRELAPNHEAHWFEIYGKIALTGEPLHFENEAKALGRHYDVCAYRVGGPESRKVAILFNDITERKVADEKVHGLYSALQTAYEDLRQTQQAVMQQERLRALGEMASGIAHDINNAISPVALYTESLLEKEPDLSPRTRQYLETTQRAIDDVAQTVARMREFYRPREPQLTLVSVDLNRLIRQVLDLTRARWSDMAQRAGIVIELNTDLAADLPAILGAESEIREALTNLVFNAVDAMPKGGTLTLRSAAVDSQHVCVEVRDTGIGMDEDTRRRCLEPFFTTKGERGTGLGLSMVYGVVKRHSAELEIESAVGQGTTVRLSFTVPVTAIVNEAPPASPAVIPTGLRILIVDDDPILLKSLSDTLEADGHRLTVCPGGEAGIDAFRNAPHTFDIVITDLGMPHIDGKQVADAVKRIVPSKPVILLTGWGQRMIAEGDIPPHVDRVLSKPPKLAILRLAFTELTGGSPA